MARRRATSKLSLRVARLLAGWLAAVRAPDSLPTVHLPLGHQSAPKSWTNSGPSCVCVCVWPTHNWSAPAANL